MPAPDLEERVAALEARLAPGPLLKPFGLPPLTEEQEAHLKRDFDETMRRPFEFRVLPSLPPLTPDQVRQLLRECVTVVKPGETLVIRDRDWNPEQVREIQRWMDAERESGRISFKVLAVIGEELGVAESEPEFMSEVREDAFRDTELRAVRLTHEPTGVTVEAPTRSEAVAKLGRALKRRGIPGAA